MNDEHRETVQSGAFRDQEDVPVTLGNTGERIGTAKVAEGDGRLMADVQIHDIGLVADPLQSSMTFSVVEDPDEQSRAIVVGRLAL